MNAVNDWPTVIEAAVVALAAAGFLRWDRRRYDPPPPVRSHVRLVRLPYDWERE